MSLRMPKAWTRIAVPFPMADNPDEVFDVVDSADRVIGRARRGRVHAENLLHRAVHILVWRGNGDIFLQKRSENKDSHPGCWDSSASGHLDSGEDYLPAARRELREELGIEVPCLEETGRLGASAETGWEFVRIYSVQNEGPFVLHPTEISGGRWLSPRDLQSWMKDEPEAFAPCFHAVWRAVRGSYPDPS